MAQSSDFKLKKGSAYHLDFFVLGVCIICTGLLGIPPCNGLIPQAPLHTKSLCVLKTEKRRGVTVDVVDRATLLRPTGASTTSTRVGHDRMCQDKQSPRVYTRPGLKRDH